MLESLDENMKFKGCPSDRSYAKKVGRPMHLLKTQAYQSKLTIKANQIVNMGTQEVLEVDNFVDTDKTDD